MICAGSDIYMVRSYDEGDHSASTRSIHASLAGALEACEQGARQEIAGWPDGEYVLSRRENRRTGYPIWCLETASHGYVVESWEVIPFVLQA